MFTILRRWAHQIDEAREFKRLLNELTNEVRLTSSDQLVQDFFSNLSSARNPVEEFISLMMTRSEIVTALRHAGYLEEQAKTKMREIYSNLLSGGAGQIVKSKSVPAVALCDPVLLALLLKAEHNGASLNELCIMALDYCQDTV